MHFAGLKSISHSIGHVCATQNWMAHPIQCLNTTVDWTSAKSTKHIYKPLKSHQNSTRSRAIHRYCMERHNSSVSVYISESLNNKISGFRTKSSRKYGQDTALPLNKAPVSWTGRYCACFMGMSQLFPAKFSTAVAREPQKQKKPNITNMLQVRHAQMHVIWMVVVIITDISWWRW